MRPENGAYQPLPSPNALKYKYLLRGKKLITKQDPVQKFNQNSDIRIQENGENEVVTKLDPEFSELISMPSVKLSYNIFKDIDERQFLFRFLGLVMKSD